MSWIKAPAAIGPSTSISLNSSLSKVERAAVLVTLMTPRTLGDSWGPVGPGPCWAHSFVAPCWAPGPGPVLGDSSGAVGPVYLLGPGPCWGHSFVGPRWTLGPVGAIHWLGPVGAIHLLGLFEQVFQTNIIIFSHLDLKDAISGEKKKQHNLC